MIGAYMAYMLGILTGNFWLSLVLGCFLSLFFGVILEIIFFSYLYRRDHLQQVLMTFGLIYILQEARKIIAGNDVHGVSVPEVLNFSLVISDHVQYPAYRLFIGAICFLIVLLMVFVLNKTKFGMRIRAASVDPETVMTLGINYRLLQRCVFALGVFLAMFSGMIIAPQSSVYPGMGQEILIICFVVVVIGGIGSIKGAFIAAMIIGFADSFGKVYWQSYSGFSIYALMIFVLLVRPHGLFRLTKS